MEGTPPRHHRLRNVAVVPKVGWAIVWLRTANVRRIAVFGAPALLVLVGLLAIWRRPEDDLQAAASREAASEPNRDAPSLAEPEPAPAPAPIASTGVTGPEPAPIVGAEATPKPLVTHLEEQPARQPQPAAQPHVQTVPALPRAGDWNLRDLERLVGADRADFPDRAEEWDFYLEAMREFADPDGWLPATLDWLVWETFAELLTTTPITREETDVPTCV